MKKIIALLLSLLLVVSAASALAEPIALKEYSQTFDMAITLPDGVTLGDVSDDENLVLIEFRFSDAKRPACLMTIAPSEDYAERSMKDLSEEEIAMVAQAASGDMDNVTCQTRTLENGMTVIDIDEETAGLSACILLTLNEGYFIQLTMMTASESKLSQSDLDLASAIVNGLSFTAVP